MLKTAMPAMLLLTFHSDLQLAAATDYERDVNAPVGLIGKA